MRVCGIDESGRGPLAGPVTAAAVVLPGGSSARRAAGSLFAALGDSKALSPEERTQAAALIRQHALAWAIGWSWPDEIDRLNIHRATLLAMNRALSGIYPLPDLVDGRLFEDRIPLRLRSPQGLSDPRTQNAGQALRSIPDSSKKLQDFLPRMNSTAWLNPERKFSRSS
jgi:ribonuclease HII